MGRGVGRRPVRRGAIWFLIVPLVLGCAPEQPPAGEISAEGGLSFTDGRGVEVMLRDPPARVISLVPSFTTLVLRMGAGEVLVARTDFDTARSVLPLPSVGTGFNPSLETIAALDPDLVIGFAGPTDPGTPAALGNLGIPFAAFDSDSVDDVLRATEILGRIVGRPAEALALARNIELDLAAVAARTAAMDPVRAAVVIGGSPPWVAGPGSYMDELLEIAGGVNVFDDLQQPFSSVSPELFAVRKIDLILLTTGATVPPGTEGIPSATLPEGIEIPGPDLARYADQLARMLHPEILP